jgi:rare lipoprotein A
MRKWILILFLISGLAPVDSVLAEEGIASYYADSLHGNLTASEESYDKNALTAAHRTLAFGTKVKVTNLDNGKSVVVRINDRGPHTGGRIIDVSGAAADKLGLKDAGTAKVELEVVESGQ